MNPKEIGRVAGGIFRTNVPSNWIVRSQEDQEDYGIDYEIELATPEDRGTGFIFKVQQKGMEHAPHNADNTFVSFSDLEVEKVDYYLKKVPIPVALVVVDITTKETYWTMLQGNPTVEKAYRDAIEGKQKTLTVHLPTSNLLPNASNDLLDAVRKTRDWIMIQGVKQTTSDQFLKAVQQDLDLDSLIEKYRHHADVLRCEQIERLLQEGKQDKAFEMAQQIYNSESETVTLRFAAGFNLIRLYGAIALGSNDSTLRNNFHNARLDISQHLVNFIRPYGNSLQLRIYARFLVRSARLNMCVEQDFGLFMSSMVQKKQSDSITQFTCYITQMTRMPAQKKLLKELRLTYRMLFEALIYELYSLIPSMWIQLVQIASRFIFCLREDSSDEAADSLVSWLEIFGKIILEIAHITKDWNSVIYGSLAYLLLVNPKNEKDKEAKVNLARQNIEAIGDENSKKEGLDALQEQMTSLFSHNERALTIEDEEQMIRQMALSNGVNLDDPDDEIAQIVNIGLRDLNPERVLKNCIFLFVSLGSCGIPARMLGLPTAGSKWLHCLKFGYSIMSLRLDNLYKSFADSHCKKCKECIPHPQDWKWSRKWQIEQDDTHSDLAKRANNFGR